MPELAKLKIMHKIVLVPLLVLASACSKSSSTSVDTSEIYLNADITGNSSNSVSCSASLHVGGLTGTYIELSGSDAIYCSDGTTEKEMDANTSVIGSVTYSASGLAYSTTATYTVRLRHSGSDYSATAQLPTALAITAPTAGATQTKNTAMTVTWTAATSDRIRLVVDYASGTSSGSFELPLESDDGTAQFAASSTAISITGNVASTLTGTRTISGSAMPSGIKGGTIEGHQEKSVTFTLVD